MFTLKHGQGRIRQSKQADETPPITNRELVILFLSIYVLSVLFVDTVLSLPPKTSVLLNRIDDFVCIFFIGDFILNIITASYKIAKEIDQGSGSPHLACSPRDPVD